jgi:uncharacterized protein
MRIKDLILPEDKVFFDLFDEMAKLIVEASSELSLLTKDIQEGAPRCRMIRELEHKGDGITRQIYERLNQSLITPLEPEEIARIAPALDNILDAIDWVGHQLCSYEISGPNESLQEFSWMIERCASEVQSGLVVLRIMKDQKEIQQHGIEINRMWNMSAELLSRVILDLFKTGDTLNIIKLKDIYESMEKILEKFNDFGHVINDIAIAHG